MQSEASGDQVPSGRPVKVNLRGRAKARMVRAATALRPLAIPRGCRPGLSRLMSIPPALHMTATSTSRATDLRWVRRAWSKFTLASLYGAVSWIMLRGGAVVLWTTTGARARKNKSKGNRTAKCMAGRKFNGVKGIKGAADTVVERTTNALQGWGSANGGDSVCPWTGDINSGWLEVGVVMSPALGYKHCR